MLVEYLQTLEVCKPKLFSEVFFFLKECFEKLFTIFRVLGKFLHCLKDTDNLLIINQL